MKLTHVLTFLLLSITAIIATACGSAASPSETRAIKSGPASNNLTATISNASGVLKKGKQDFTLSFTDASGKTVDVGAASLNFFMPAMGSMAAMNNPATIKTSGTPGVYVCTVDLEMSGEWQAQITYEGPAGKGRATLPITAQ